MISAKVFWVLGIGKVVVAEGLEEGEAHCGLFLLRELVQEGSVLETEFSQEEMPFAPYSVIFFVGCFGPCVEDAILRLRVQ
jgi:hypothetical protein